MSMEFPIWLEKNPLITTSRIVETRVINIISINERVIRDFIDFLMKKLTMTTIEITIPEIPNWYDKFIIANPRCFFYASILYNELYHRNTERLLQFFTNFMTNLTVMS